MKIKYDHDLNLPLIYSNNKLEDINNDEEDNGNDVEFISQLQ